MLKRSVSLLAVLAMASVANAGAVAELRLADLSGNPITAPASGFSPGDQFVVEVWVNPDQTLIMREMTLDYRASDPAIAAGFGMDIDTINQPPDGVPNFWFDYTGAGFGTFPARGLYEPLPMAAPGFFAPSTANYKDFSNLVSGSPAAPAPVATATSDSSASSNLKTLTGGVFNRVGGMPITIPSGISGDFLVDLLGSPDGLTDNRNDGSSITFGFGANDPDPNVPPDPVTIWATAVDDASVNGSFGYAQGAGPLTVTVVPEPATLALLGLGGLMALRRRRKTA